MTEKERNEYFYYESAWDRVEKPDEMFHVYKLEYKGRTFYKLKALIALDEYNLDLHRPEETEEWRTEKFYALRPDGKLVRSSVTQIREMMREADRK